MQLKKKVLTFEIMAMTEIDIDMCRQRWNPKYGLQLQMHEVHVLKFGKSRKGLGLKFLIALGSNA